jgi:hypothetical protein
VSLLGHPLDIIPEQLTAVGSFYTQPTTEANTEGIPSDPNFQHHPPLMVPVLGGLLPRSWAELRSSPPDEVTRISYYSVVSSGGVRHRSCSPVMQSDFCGILPFSTCLSIDVPVEAMGTGQAAYTEPQPYLCNPQLARRPVHRDQGRQCGHAARQIGDRETHNRPRYTCPVADCGKRFSGQSERNRHVRSKHRPPTMGCRKCNYKQSRRDLFREHCRKRHLGESIEDLLVQLVQGDQAHNAAAGLRTGDNSQT